MTPIRADGYALTRGAARLAGSAAGAGVGGSPGAVLARSWAIASQAIASPWPSKNAEPEGFRRMMCWATGARTIASRLGSPLRLTSAL